MHTHTHSLSHTHTLTDQGRQAEEAPVHPFSEGSGAPSGAAERAHAGNVVDEAAQGMRMCVYLYVSVRVCMYVCVCMHVCVYLSVCELMQAMSSMKLHKVCVCVSECVRMCERTRVCVYQCMQYPYDHTHTLTHTQTRSASAVDTPVTSSAAVVDGRMTLQAIRLRKSEKKDLLTELREKKATLLKPTTDTQGIYICVCVCVCLCITV
jgi:hypothetical protein